MKNYNVHLIVGLLVSLALLVWVICRTDWGEVGQQLLEANWLMLLAVFVGMIASVALRSWRWGIMLESEDAECSFLTLFDLTSLNYLANNLLPARLGDIIRAYLSGEWMNVSFSFALSTTVVERVLDTLFVVIMLFGILPFLPVPVPVAQTGLLLGIAFFFGGVMLVIAAWQREMSERLIRTFLRPLPLSEPLWTDRLVALLDGFALVRQPLRFARVLWSTLIIWLVGSCSYWFALRAFNLDFLDSEVSFTISLVALGTAVPSGPAAAGTFDAAITGALEIFNVPTALAGGVALIIHVINFIALTTLGACSLRRRGLSLGCLASQAKMVGSGSTGVMRPKEIR